MVVAGRSCLSCRETKSSMESREPNLGAAFRFRTRALVVDEIDVGTMPTHRPRLPIHTLDLPVVEVQIISL